MSADHTHPLSPVLPPSTRSFRDRAGDTWHYDAYGQHWRSESGDEPDPDALVSELAALYHKLDDVYHFVYGLYLARGLRDFPADFPPLANPGVFPPSTED